MTRRGFPSVIEKAVLRGEKKRTIRAGKSWSLFFAELLKASHCPLLTSTRILPLWSPSGQR
jgi:hypothetical protein